MTIGNPGFRNGNYVLILELNFNPLTKFVMKKLFLTFCVSVATVVAAHAVTLHTPDGEEPKKELTTRDICINDLTYPAEKEQARSAGSIVDASYSAEGSMLEFWFNMEVGSVKITVTDAMGTALAVYACNTEIEPYVLIPIFLSADNAYTIRIVGTEYEGVGYIQ